MPIDSQIQQPDSAVKKEYELKFYGESCEINAPAELPAGECAPRLHQKANKDPY